MTSPKPDRGLARRGTPRPLVPRCVIDNEPLRSNAERRVGLCAYHLATLVKQ